MYVGGKLHRLIGDNFYNMIKDSLGDLGWFDEGRGHESVTMVPEPIGSDENVKPNLIAVSDEDISQSEMELGSNLTEHRFLYYIDVYAESTAVGKNLSGDIKDILEGRFNSIGRDSNRLEVLDLSQSIPSHLFYADIEEVTVDRSRFSNRPFEKYWWVIYCDVVFSYSNEYSNY
jgi:hypothetical protein